MKNIIQIRKECWPSHSVGNISNLLANLIRTNEARSKFLILQRTSNTSHMNDYQKYMVTLSELKSLPPLIMVTFLPTLRCLHLLLDHLHIFRSLMHNLWSKYNTLSRLIPTQMNHTPFPIQIFE